LNYETINVNWDGNGRNVTEMIKGMEDLQID
jgi:hypothetical protein